jgi:hypothetical protein
LNLLQLSSFLIRLSLSLFHNRESTVAQDRTSMRVMPLLQQAPVSWPPRQAQSTPNKIPIAVVGEDYDWWDIPLASNQQEIPVPPPVFSLPYSISLYQDNDLLPGPKTSKRNLTRNT